MPYFSSDDLPPGVRLHLPEHAEDIFREASNHVEEIAHRMTWAAVKKVYEKPDTQWLPR